MNYYCLVDFLALLVLLITNHDVLGKKTETEERSIQKRYRFFLYAVATYYVVDAIWAWLYGIGNIDWLYVDTEIYFVVMALGILLWIRYIVAYSRIDNSFGQLLIYAGWILFVTALVITPLNRWRPLMFWFVDGVYYCGILRDAMFVYQVLLLLLASSYMLLFTAYISERQRKRRLAIGLSGLIMMFFIAVQISLSTYPLYAISYMLGCCLLRTFVIENEREELRRDLQVALDREKNQLQELQKAKDNAYKDSLTGVKSRLAYVEKKDILDGQILKGIRDDFAVVVMDINNLKIINDTLGHDVGDEFIRKACRLICNTFKRSPVYRIGGDEFVAILEGEDYGNRNMLLESFNHEIEQNRQNGSVIVAIGMAEYVPQQDLSYKRLFDRADEAMYKRKQELKVVADSSFAVRKKA
ncbi:MAG: GGDEF domain-containing protein [Selenomonas sp.]|uniref:GGDEF domain-containing protein n=1 Tax=Selenomonas sp. TaxID=2053611 RepID=UPI0025CE32BF|nr:GGDEF domain-containing protein [Selenomonas sp.]MCR5756556.1 GGDEF domain-containing protein [Selenomonas sp.]